MNEAKFTTKLKKWVANEFPHTCGIEVKYTENGRIRFDGVAEHQLDALKKMSDGSLVYKIPDDSRGRKPFDLMSYCQSLAYVCLYFYSHGEDKFYLFSVEDWQTMRDEADRKSATQEMAREYATYVGQLK